MADINKADIKMMQSQRLDDTDQGGGQMTSNEVINGEVNNLFPDISRLDRVYGRVSMRKSYLAVQTDARETYYGSHTILTEQTKDPNVSVCFFSSEDWFDTREDARDRIESYLVRGPLAQLSLWGNHYRGTSVLTFLSREDASEPDVGAVMVLKSSSSEQYVRIIDISSEVREFYWEANDSKYNLKVLAITIGNAIEEDYVGVEADPSLVTSDDPTLIYNTVAADASKYYGVTTLAESASENEFQLRVTDIMENLVPSAASETAIVDATVGQAVSPLIQTADDTAATITRSISFSIASSSKLYIGEGIKRGTFIWNGGGLSLRDDSAGNVLNGSVIVGAIVYSTGTVTFGDPGVTTSGTGTVTYIPACSPEQVSDTGAIIISTSNRGFVYTFNCNPIPEPGTLKVEYLSGGKWYTMWDNGVGKIEGLEGYDVGSGTLNFNTGSVSLTLKASPDVDSKIIFFWNKPAEFYDFSGEVLPIRYAFTTDNGAIARNSFEFTWIGDGNGSGESGEYCITDDGAGNLVVGTWNAGGYWDTTVTVVGTIRYATGEIDTGIADSQYTPKASEVFNIKYNYGDPEIVTFEMPPRDAQGRLNLSLTNVPIVPGTFKIEWHTDITVYDPETRIDMTKDPVFIFRDDGAGNFEGDVDDGTTNWIQGTVDYATGDIQFMPDRNTVFPIMKYEWKETAWLHPGVEESYVFDHIQYLPTAAIFPTEGSVVVSYCTLDGANLDDYSGTIPPIYMIREDSGLEIISGGLGLTSGSANILDGGDGRLYTHVDGVAGNKTEVGTVNYANKTFTISSDSISLKNITVRVCSGTAAIDPAMSLVFRAPGSPIRPGSAFIKAVNSQGDIIEGNAGFDGVIVGTGITGQVDHDTGLCHVIFGEWVTDDETAQNSEWYSATANDGAGNVWKPYSVSASTIIMNCVITSYLPLDPDLLGLNPVRLPLDGKVPIFRDGYIIVVHHSTTEELTNPLNATNPIPADQTFSIGVDRTDVNLIELYSVPTDLQLEEGTQTVSLYISELQEDGDPNYSYDLELGTITIYAGFTYPSDTEGTPNQLVVLSRIEDMCLCSDVQITGHIAITSPLVHDYPAEETLVSSVLPSADLQSRAYNEFEQSTWTGVWSDILIGSIPLASYNFVDYPISVINRPSIKERWLIRFDTSNTISVVGENFGVLATGLSILDDSTGQTSGAHGKIQIAGEWCIAIENRQFPGEHYWVLRCAGFGAGWSAGNCIRFNQDAANFPLWFVRTTLQAPPKESIDHYTIQIRGDSS